MQAPLSARAPGKLMVTGEYAVLDGAPAVVTAVDRYAVASLSAAPRYEIHSPTLGVRATFTLALGRLAWDAAVTTAEREALALVAACIEEAAGDLKAVALALDTRELQDAASGLKLGLGSSAAAAVALCGVLMAHRGEDDRERLFAAAWAAHRRTQGQGSGADVAAACFGGSLVFHPSAAQRVEVVSLPVALVCVWTGRAAQTGALVREVQRYKERDAAGYAVQMSALKRAAEQGVSAARAADAEAFCGAIDHYGDALAALGRASGAAIWSEEHRRWQEIVRAAGGVYKPSGAGGGDVGIAVAPTAAAARGLTRVLVDAQAAVVPLRVAARGFHIESEP